MGIVNDGTGICTELFNNSIVLDGASIITTQCGPRCAGRSGSVATWIKPPSSWLELWVGTDRTYTDFLRNTTGKVTNGADEGIYTCSVENGLYTLHIGLYYNDPGMMHATDTS